MTLGVPIFSNKIKVCDLVTICFSGCIENETLDLDLNEKHKKNTYINQKYTGHGFTIALDTGYRGLLR